MTNAPIRLLELSGAPDEIGYAHGLAYRDAIRRLAEERLALVQGGQWTGYPLTRAEVLQLAEACLPEHAAYAPDLMLELQGMAAATDLTLGELVVVNGFTDFVDTVYNQPGPTPAGVREGDDDCTAVIVPDGMAEGQGMLAQTWDMHASATPFVFLLRCRPAGHLACLTFTLAGCIGMIGMNEAGLAVGINNLLGADGQIGVTWPFVVRKILQHTNAEEALACLTTARLAGAHNYLLFDRSGRGYNVEAMSTRLHVTELNSAGLAHTNHCLAPQTQAVAQIRPAESQASSENRLAQAYHYLGMRPITPELLMEMTRDTSAICVTTPRPPLFVETCGAVIMRPKTGDFWAVWGLPTENAYRRFQV